ncbi:MAG TPA: hypothetical protein VK638_40515 [Edaphobacter sp.]|nr:hypothetical protein [Edaphobacter sp.]
MSLRKAGAFLYMGYIKGDGRNQGTLFPVLLDDFVPADLNLMLSRRSYGSDLRRPLKALTFTLKSSVFWQDHERRLILSLSS